MFECVWVDIKGWKASTIYLVSGRKNLNLFHFNLTKFYLFTNSFLFITFQNRNTSITQILKQLVMSDTYT